MLYKCLWYPYPVRRTYCNGLEISWNVYFLSNCSFATIFGLTAVANCLLFSGFYSGVFTQALVGYSGDLYEPIPN
jgi:hypothetical protein